MKINDIEFTALTSACAKNMPEVALALIATGKSNPEVRSKDGNTALDIAKDNGMTTVVDALLALTSAPVSSCPEVIGTEVSDERINVEVERRFKEILEKKELAKKVFEKEVEERLAKKLREMGLVT
jgi:ankyrin repeat protein